MSGSAFCVPTPADDHHTIHAAGRRMHAVGEELQHHHARLAAAGHLAGGQWVGEAAVQFGAVHAQGLAHLQRVAVAHRRHGEAHLQYARHVEEAARIAARVRSDVDAHAAAYRQNVRRSLDELHREAQHKFQEAADHLQKAKDEFWGDPLRAVGDAWEGATSAIEGIADSAVEALLSHLSAWEPTVPSAELIASRPSVDKVMTLTGDVVLNELAGLGDALATGLLEGFRDVLSAMGLDAAARAVGAVEAEFADAAARSFNEAAHCFAELEQAALTIAQQIEREIVAGLETAWHAVETVAKATYDGIQWLEKEVEEGAAWTWEHRGEILDVIGDVCTVAAIFAPPPFDLIAGAIAIGVSVAQTTDDLVHGNFKKAAWDSLGFLLPGAGKVAGKVIKGAGESAKIAKQAETLANDARILRTEESGARAEGEFYRAIGHDAQATHAEQYADDVARDAAAKEGQAAAKQAEHDATRLSHRKTAEFLQRHGVDVTVTAEREAVTQAAHEVADLLGDAHDYTDLALHTAENYAPAAVHAGQAGVRAVRASIPTLERWVREYPPILAA